MQVFIFGESDKWGDARRLARRGRTKPDEIAPWLEAGKGCPFVVLSFIYLNNIYFLEENLINIFVFLYNICVFSIILSRSTFLIAIFFFAFYLNLFSKYFVVKLLVLYT